MNGSNAGPAAIPSPLPRSIVCAGEVLWDRLPAGEFLGGAPLNVAAHLARLGVPVRLVSRLGRDARGTAAHARIVALGLDPALVQLDATRPTGTAEAWLDATGAASYRFPAPAAWDAIEAGEAELEAAHGATVVFGTLAQRDAASAAAIARLLAVARWRVLDANLRAPHDDQRVALRSLARADFVKLNEHEVVAFAGWLGIAPSAAALQVCLRTQFGIRSLCVTEGERGARLWHGETYVAVPAVPTQVADTVGAGDAFLAMLLAALGAGRPAEDAMARATRLAAFVASQSGATPEYRAADFLG
ncbi:MAG: carbohydrate kinase [Proteobacteria bacterium]|nr:carbohydrate kinase [Pseudomonadota bacterium]